MSVDSGLSAQEVADRLNISKNTVYEMIKRGELPSYRIGRKVRVDEADIEEYKNRTRTGGVKAKAPSQPTFAEPVVLSNTNQILGQYNRVQTNYKNEFIICGQDLLLDVLTRHLECHPKGVQALRYYVGSYNGLVELYKDNVSIATAHLWDSDTGEYNVPYVRRLIPGVPCVIINLVYRMQGFYVAKGNPKNIKTWEDLIRPDVKMVNREPGCGVRVFIDEQLRKNKIPHQMVAGYNYQETSHLSVASAVARGNADVGVGNEKASMQVKDVEFVPLKKERYDLVIKEEFINTQAIQTTLEIINSEEFKSELKGIGGYDLSDIGKIMATT